MSCRSSRISQQPIETKVPKQHDLKLLLADLKNAINQLSKDFDTHKAELCKEFLQSLKKYEKDKKRSITDVPKEVKKSNGHLQIGEKLLLYPKKVIATVGKVKIFEGLYDGRPVNVKRQLLSVNEKSPKEIPNHKKSDHGKNILRLYGTERDKEFIYIAFERETCTLPDLIRICSAQSLCKNDRLESLKQDLGDVIITSYRNNKHGLSEPMLKLMREITSGFAHLHGLGIIHNNLKPENILIVKYGSSLCAKLSDFEKSQNLAEGNPSRSYDTTSNRVHYRADLFALGRILFFCITGKDPFGDDTISQNTNIKNNIIPNLQMLNHFSTAEDLIMKLLKPDPNLRLAATDSLNHSMFFGPDKFLSFICDVSNKMFDFDLGLLEKTKDTVLGKDSSGKLVPWDTKVHNQIIEHARKYDKYDGLSVRSLLRIIRNSWNHLDERPSDVKAIFGFVEGYGYYFTHLFPKLLVEVHNVVWEHCHTQPDFMRRYIDEK